MITKYADKIRDFLVVISGTWFMLLFDLLAFVAFLFISQGRDVLLVVTENVGNFTHKWQLAALLAAVFFWSVTSEYVTRMLNYLSDNTGKALNPQRVANRKKSQRIINLLSLFYPNLLMLIAFTSIYVSNYKAISAASNLYNLHRIEIGTIIIIILFILEIALLCWLYPGKLIVKLSQKYKLLSWASLSKNESQWVNKLYGILNELRVDLPAEGHTIFTGKDLPRNRLLPNGMTLPDSPYFVAEDQNPLSLKGGIKVWMFKIKLPFYHNLIRQLAILSAISVTIIISIGFFFPISWTTGFGATSIICFSFACWQLIYLVIYFLDKAQSFPIRFALLIWLVICSVINNDHPVRLLSQKLTDRPTLNAHFEDWTKRTTADTTSNYYRIGQADSIPVIFVSAEGGALRTGAFTALLLARLQDRFPLFQKYLYGYSSVSGGTLGSNFFNAQIIRNQHKPINDENRWFDASKKFFKTDFLSALTAKLVFAEIINYFIPFHIPAADRAIALERSFETGWHNAYPEDTDNLLSNSFNQTINPLLPALFINTTAVETGNQNVWSNVNLNVLPLASARDLYPFAGTAISYSSAINLSNRFPLISPAGCFFIRTKGHRGQDSTYRRHFVDGGYYENKGSETLLQVMKALHLENKKIKPYILQFNFSGDTTIRSITAFNEISEIAGAIYNTRNGRGNIAQDLLKKYVDSLHGVFIPLNLQLNSKELPMNWILSNTAADRLDQAIKQLVGKQENTQPDKLFKDGARDQLQKLFFYDPIHNLRTPKPKPTH